MTRPSIIGRIIDEIVRTMSRFLDAEKVTRPIGRRKRKPVARGWNCRGDLIELHPTKGWRRVR